MTESPHILIVDDNVEILQIVSVILTRNHYRVSVKSRMDDFIGDVKEIQPDLLLLDKTLGWGDGCELCALLKTDASLKHIPVVMFSAYHKIQEDCMAAGADGFLQKPFEMAELLHVIRSFTSPKSAID